MSFDHQLIGISLRSEMMVEQEYEYRIHDDTEIVMWLAD